ncbi:hypothetical protein AtEden1_Chr5g0130281 [Arabidopsis thaliana]
MLQTESPSQRIHPTFRLPGDELPAYFTHRVHGNVLTVSLPRISLSKQILRYKACIVVESRPGAVNDPPAELSYGDVQFEFLCLDHRKEIIKIKECGIQLMEVSPYLDDSRKRSGTEDGNKPAEKDEELRRIRKQMRIT